MAASSATTRRSSGPVLRSHSPSSGKFYATSHKASSSSSAFASSSASSFSARFNIHRSASPTRVNLYSSGSSPATAVRFSIDRPTSPNRSISAQRRPEQQRKRTCMCSPTNHPGSFRCSLHKNSGSSRPAQTGGGPYQSNRLYARRSAMTNSLVRIGTVEGDLVKRALAALIRPSSHSQRRRADFQPRPSRLSVVSNAQDSL